MEIVKILGKITGQNIVLILLFLLVSCLLEKTSFIIGDTASYVAFMLTWPILLLTFFFSNAELFKWVKNDYLWSLSSAIPSVLLTTGTVMYAVHNTCKIPFYG